MYMGSLLMLALAAETVALVWPVADRGRAVAWLAVIATIEAALFLLIRQFHAKVRPDRDLPGWGRARAGLEGLHGLCWGAAIVVLTGPDPTVLRLGALTALVGLVSAAAPGFAVYPPAGLAFAGGAVAPAALWLAVARPQHGDGYAAVMLLMSLVFAGVNTLRWSVIHAEAIRLRLELARGLEVRRQLLDEAVAARRVADAARAEQLRFFGAASHDLRQPVHAMGLYVDVLRSDPPPAERRAVIQEIGACMSSLDALFDAILGLAQADHAPAPAPFPLQPLIDRATAQVAPLARAKGLALRRVPTAAWVKGNPVAVERMLLNLLTNAIRYTARGGVLVGVRRAGVRIDLQVADTGVGVAEEDQVRIFEPFARGQAAGGAAPPGYGLGLATVSQLALCNDTPVHIRSTAGKGSCFSISLPRASAAQDAPAGRRAGAASRRVLLVEDDRSTAVALEKFLGDLGAEVTAVTSAAEAEAAVAAQRPDLVLADNHIAGERCGLDLIEGLRASGAGVRCILITGDLDPEVFRRAAALDAPVLRKPVKPVRLQALLSAG